MRKKMGVKPDVNLVASLTNLADDLFEKIFDRQKTGRAPKLIDHNHHVRIVLTHSFEYLLETRSLWHIRHSTHQFCYRTRIAFELIARDIRQAGVTGCGNVGRVGNILNNGTSAGGTSELGLDLAVSTPTARALVVLGPPSSRSPSSVSLASVGAGAHGADAHGAPHLGQSSRSPDPAGRRTRGFGGLSPFRSSSPGHTCR
jgi:hypothetical protein